MGDFIIVILIFSLIKSIVNINSLYIAAAVLFFAYTAELFQLLHLLDFLGLKNNMAAVIILGSTFDFKDIAAYTSGIASIYIIDIILINACKERS